MTHADWVEVLRKAPVGGDAWLGYAIWLRDEHDDAAGADAMEWLVSEGKYPALAEKGQWYWAGPGGREPSRHIPAPRHAVLPPPVFVVLAGDRWDFLASRWYRGRVEAFLAAVQALREVGVPRGAPAVQA
jgi:hypothetical protein